MPVSSAPNLVSIEGTIMPPKDTPVQAMVRRALAEDRVVLAMQPVVHARHTSRTAFCEGLVRMKDEAGELISASAFISKVETHSLGRDLDRAALRLGLEALASDPTLRLSINMSVQTIGNTAWCTELEQGLAVDATVAERLILEITESSAMEQPQIVADFIDTYRRQGVSFAMDDFGSGYTSFRHLRDFDFDFVKLDGTFSRDVHCNKDNQTLVKALIGIADHFEMLTVCEAVETPKEAAYLASIGVGTLQGYLFGKPTVQPASQPGEALHQGIRA